MQNLLEGVRVFDVLAAAQPSATASPYSEEPTPSPQPKRHSEGNFDAVAIVAIVFTFIYLIIKAVMAPLHSRNRIVGQNVPAGGLTQEEVAVLQKLQRTLSQMESRVEALETILIEQARTEKNYGPKL